jgi:peptide chain release factor 1
VFEMVADLVAEHAELERQLADPSVHSDPPRARRLGRRYAELGAIVSTHDEWRRALGDLQAARELAEQDDGFAAEAEHLADRAADLEDRLRGLLLPRDPNDNRDVIMEIKAGEGGEESALFAADLLRMYLRFAERAGWRTEILDAEESDLGGYKDVSVAVKAKGTPQPGTAPYARLKY